jgi:hypothetical protein
MRTSSKAAAGGRFGFVLVACLAFGFAIGVVSVVAGVTFGVVAPSHAANDGPGAARGRGHAYGREIADLVRETQAKGKDKKAFLDELKRRGHKVSGKPDRKANQERDKRIKENRAVAREPVDKTLLRKTGQEVLRRDKIKNASDETKAAVRRTHGLD